MKKINWRGRYVGRLYVLREVVREGRGPYWSCVCECGGVKVASAGQLASRRVRSCGCLQKQDAGRRAVLLNTTHGMTGCPTWTSWQAMCDRCRNPRHHAYPRYGGRGIGVCERWRSFANFFADMGFRPAGCTLDRIDNDRGYGPDNCRWANWRQQASNRSNNVWLTVDGDARTMSEWARSLDTSVQVLSRRRKAGWSDERIVRTPVARRGSRAKEER
jgi:hypothetical protein